MNSDSACAAPALLASSLLQRPLEDGKSQAQQITVEHSNWDLNSDITIGIPVISGESSVFASGRVVGISGFQPATHRPQGVRNEDESTVVRNWVLEVCKPIVTDHYCGLSVILVESVASFLLKGVMLTYPVSCLRISLLRFSLGHICLRDHWEYQRPPTQLTRNPRCHKLS